MKPSKWKPSWLIDTRLFTEELRGGDDYNYYDSLSSLLPLFTHTVASFFIYHQYLPALFIVYHPPPPPPPSVAISSPPPEQCFPFSRPSHVWEGRSAEESSAQREFGSFSANYSLLQTSLAL